MHCSKKAQSLAVATFMIIIFVAAISIVLSKYVFTQTINAFNNTGVLNATQLATVNQFGVGFGIIDTMFLVLVAGLTIVIFITAYVVRSHPIWLIPNLIAMLIMVFVSMVLSDTFGEFIGVTELAAEISTFSLTQYFMSILPYYTVVVCVLSFIVMMGKSNE